MRRPVRTAPVLPWALLPWALLAGLLVAQAGVGQALTGQRADGGVLGAPPDATATAVMALGDEQTLFRALAQHLFVAGDLGGRITPFTRLDYDHVAAWLDRLVALDPQSQLPDALAMLYFAQSPRPDQVAVMVRWTRKAVARDPLRLWRWLTHAAVAARHRVKDLPLALEVARDMAALGRAHPKEIPFWTQQMPAFTLDAMGEHDAATALMGALLRNPEGLDDGEIMYMRRYLEGEFRPLRPDGTKGR